MTLLISNLLSRLDALSQLYQLYYLTERDMDR